MSRFPLIFPPGAVAAFVIWINTKLLQVIADERTANPRMPHDLWASAIELERKINLEKKINKTFLDSVSLANFMVF